MMKLSRITLGVFLCALHLSCGGSVPAPLAPDTVLYNAKIVTVDEDFSIAQAVAIKNGRFVEVGSDSQVLALAAESTEKIDLEGKTVLPGFYDGHVHVAGAAGEAPDPLSNQMREVTSIEEVVELVRQKVAATPPGGNNNPVKGDGRDPDEYFDRSSGDFVLQDVGVWGNAGRNTLVLGGTATFDLSLQKDTPIAGERVKLQFRAEFFNLLNRANWGAPGTRSSYSSSFGTRGLCPGGNCSNTSYQGVFGRVTTTSTSTRQVQLALKIIF